MNRFRFPPSIYLSISIGVVILLLTTFAGSFGYLSLERLQVDRGQLWRIVTGNFVHFGWAHTLMNLAAFLLCAFALFNRESAIKFTALLLVCSLGVGTGVYFLNPEYETYAGLSGVIHGLIVAGLLINKRHSFRINGIFIALLFAKIIFEHLPGYRATELQTMLPVAVAYDAHLYGALAGLLFGSLDLLFRYLKRKK